MTKKSKDKEPHKSISGKYELIVIDNIVDNPNNPRKNYNEIDLQELTDSIKEVGIIQPITVREIENNNYEVVAGSRRYRAAKLANMGAVPAVIKDLTDDQALEISIVENLQRKDVHVMEEASSIKQLIDNGYKMEDVAVKLGKPLQYVVQRMKFNNLIDELQELFYKDIIPYRFAFKLARFNNDIQKECFEENREDLEKGGFEEWDLKQFEKSNTEDLSKATFDIEDKNLLPKAGTCTTCQFNSSFASLLFPEYANKKICSNIKCFKEKTKITLEAQLKEVMENNSIIIISAGWYNPSKEEKEIINKLVDGGHTILTYLDIDKIEKPEILSFEDWLEGECCFDEYETNEEDQAQYGYYLNEKKTETENYNAEIKDAEQAFILFGQQAGKYIYFKYSSKNGALKSITETSPDAAIHQAIAEAETKLNRIGELDNEKLFAKVKELANKDGYHFEAKNKMLTLYWFIKCPFSVKKEFCNEHAINMYQPKESDIEKIIDNINSWTLDKWIYATFLEEFKNTISVSTLKGAALMKCICAFDDIREEIDTLTLQLEEKSIKQKEKLETQIAELNLKLSKKADR